MSPPPDRTREVPSETVDTETTDDRVVDIESELLREDADASADAGTDAAETSSSSSLTSRLFGGGGGLFSLRVFVPTLVLLLVGLVAGSAVPLVGVVGRFVGLFAAAFAVGLVARSRHYLEVGTAALAASGLGFVLSVFSGQFLGILAGLVGGDATQVGLVVGGVGIGTGVLVALAGYYFGRDLRSGLTADLGE